MNRNKRPLLFQNDNPQKKPRVIYHGEEQCDATKADGRHCENFAYFSLGSAIRCGVHAKKGHAQKLPVNPAKKEREAAEKAKHEQEIQEVAAVHRSKGKKGEVILYKMRMFKTPPYRSGFLNVLPNYLDKHPKEGLGLPALSPKSIGPIEHGQPGLPQSLNLENFHQGNKVFPCEMEGDIILPAFYATRLAMYQDPIPHRHKEVAKGKNVPVCSVWIRKDGSEQRVSYVESRQFYCTFYERHVSLLPEYALLRQRIAEGTNLQLCGYDAYQPTQSIEACYLDATKPFGHELVLYCMLILEPSEYPWRKHLMEW